MSAYPLIRGNRLVAGDAMKKSYKYKIQSQSNVIKIGNMLDDMWHIHVHIMRMSRRYYRMFGKNLSAYRLNAHIAKLKKRTQPHWKDLPSQVVQDVVLRYGKSQDAFLRNIKDRKECKTYKKVGRPKIKSRSKYNSMTFTQAGYTLQGNRIKINCIDTWFTFHKHREIKGIIKTVTFKRDKCGDYWLCFSCDNVDDSEPKPMTGKNAGFDYGNKTFLTSDTDKRIESPQFLKQSLSQLRTLNKALSRKVKGSGNWWRCVRELARLHRKIARQRLDWQWKLATELCRQFDILIFETLNLDGMKRLWGRKVSDHAFYQFLEILKQKCAKHGKQLVQISQWTATTKPCSDCGYHNKELTLSDRQWTCPKCGSHHDRDVNAAVNIKRAGLAA